MPKASQTTRPETSDPSEPMPDEPQENDKPSTNGVFHHGYSYWWRELAAGIAAVGLGAFDVWHFGRDAGFTSSLDEILILTGVALIAGVRNLFGNQPPPPK